MKSLQVVHRFYRLARLATRRPVYGPDWTFRITIHRLPNPVKFWNYIQFEDSIRDSSVNIILTPTKIH